MPDRQTDSFHLRWVIQIAMQRVACNKLRGMLCVFLPLPSALLQSAIERAIFSTPRSIRHAPAQLRLDLELELQLGFGCGFGLTKDISLATVS